MVLRRVLTRYWSYVNPMHVCIICGCVGLTLLTFIFLLELSSDVGGRVVGLGLALDPRWSPACPRFSRHRRQPSPPGSPRSRSPGLPTFGSAAGSGADHDHVDVCSRAAYHARAAAMLQLPLPMEANQTPLRVGLLCLHPFQNVAGLFG